MDGVSARGSTHWLAGYRPEIAFKHPTQETPCGVLIPPTDTSALAAMHSICESLGHEASAPVAALRWFEFSRICLHEESRSLYRFRPDHHKEFVRSSIQNRPVESRLGAGTTGKICTVLSSLLLWSPGHSSNGQLFGPQKRKPGNQKGRELMIEIMPLPRNFAVHRPDLSVEPLKFFRDWKLRALGDGISGTKPDCFFCPDLFTTDSPLQVLQRFKCLLKPSRVSNCFDCPVL